MCAFPLHLITFPKQYLPKAVMTKHCQHSALLRLGKSVLRLRRSHLCPCFDAPCRNHSLHFMAFPEPDFTSQFHCVTVHLHSVSSRCISDAGLIYAQAELCFPKAMRLRTLPIQLDAIPPLCEPLQCKSFAMKINSIAVKVDAMPMAVQCNALPFRCLSALSLPELRITVQCKSLAFRC